MRYAIIFIAIISFLILGFLVVGKADKFFLENYKGFNYEENENNLIENEENENF